MLDSAITLWKKEVSDFIHKYGPVYHLDSPTLKSESLKFILPPGKIQTLRMTKNIDQSSKEQAQFRVELTQRELTKITPMQDGRQDYRGLLSLSKHSGIVIQNVENCSILAKQSAAVINKWEIVEKIPLVKGQPPGKKEAELPVKKQFQYLSAILMTPWPRDSPRNSFRVIFLMGDSVRGEENYFIYHQAFVGCAKSVQEISQVLKSTGQCENIVQALKVHYIKQKYNAELSMFKQRFQNSIGASFKAQYRSIWEEREREREERHRKFTNNNLIEAYDNYHCKSMAEKWRNKVKDYKNNKNLFVEVEKISIQNNQIPSQVFLYLQDNKAQGKYYHYDQIQKDYLVFSLNQNSPQLKKSRNFRIKLDPKQFSQQIQFLLELTYQNSSSNSVLTQFFSYYSYMNEYSAFTQELVLSDRNGSQAILNINMIESRRDQISKVSTFNKALLLDQMGAVPTKYGSFLPVQYTPNNYAKVARLMNGNQKLSKVSFEEIYLRLVDFVQEEQNKSQSSILFDKSQSNKYSYGTNKYLMKDRFQQYKRKLIDSFGYDHKGQLSLAQCFKDQFQGDVWKIIQNSSDFKVSHNIAKNMKEDFKNYKLLPLSEEAALFHLNRFIFLTQFGGSLESKSADNKMRLMRYVSHLIPILDKFLFVLASGIYGRQSTVKIAENDSETFWTWVAFIFKMYPYFDLKCLKEDLYAIRSLAQQKLRHFNFYLNRSHLGLQNVAVRHLLSLFTEGLSEELTFCIWDYLISNQDPAKARVIICFTLLTYYQSTEMLPIIPINQFFKSVQSNMQSISINQGHRAKFAQSVEQHCADEVKQMNKIIAIGKESEESFLAQDKYLKRFIFGSMGNKIPLEEEGKVQHISKRDGLLKSKLLSIQQIQYPLPKGGHMGDEIIEIRLFISHILILESLHMTAGRYRLKVTNQLYEQMQNNISTFNSEYPLIQKDYFINEPITIPLSLENKTLLKVLIWEIVDTQTAGKGPNRHAVVMKGELNFQHYLKDKMYKEIVRLYPVGPLKNKGESLINITLCLKSTHFRQKSETSNFASIEQISGNLLDYDISSENNEAFRQLSTLFKQFEQIKNPLDQFGKNKYSKLKLAFQNNNQANISEWIQNSKLTIEELRAVFYTIFYEEKEKQIRLHFSKYYETFTEQNDFQHVYLSKILFQSILLSGGTTSSNKKLMYLYCLAVHYQNSYSKTMTIETLNSVIKEIYHVYGMLNACPYEKRYCGSIVQGYFYSTLQKNEEKKKDITEILEDWAYMCMLKFGYNCLVMGSARDLLVLRSLLDLETIRQIEQQPTCRFEIIYKHNSSKYIWSVTVKSKSFQIVDRGTKFLSSFSGYNEIKYLDSTQQSLYNCQNIVPLQSHSNITFEQFSKVINQNPLLSYLLSQPPVTSPLNSYSRDKKQEVVRGEMRKTVSESSISFQSKDNSNDEEETRYISWAVYRSHSCAVEWRKCRIQLYSEPTSQVTFEEQKGKVYEVLSIEIVSMEESG